MRTYVIQFDFPGADPVYAGDHKGAWGFAESLETAHLFLDAMGGRRVLDNGYGEHTRQWGSVRPVPRGGEVAGKVWVVVENCDGWSTRTRVSSVHATKEGAEAEAARLNADPRAVSDNYGDPYTVAEEELLP